MSKPRGYGAFRRIVASATAPHATYIGESISRRPFSAKQRPWTCPSCRETQRKSLIAERALQRRSGFSRPISTSVWRQEEARRETDPPSSTKPTYSTPANALDERASNLPSQTAQQRWQTSQRLHRLMDAALARASIASQRINTYTGTDYTGIEALRQKITDQETTVKERHAAVDVARTAHREAHSKQSSAQKEIVSLLERKSSWSPGDLERYMGLVRSEHSLEADVGEAKDGLQAAERELEDARGLLERLERKQYHEEQVWSDTIRRNSTWVTFGLMGVNIVLLLAQIAVFEPYRRKKIVREVKVALDEKAAAGNVVGGFVAPKAEVESAVDEFVEPTGEPMRVVEQAVGGEEARLAQEAAQDTNVKSDQTALAAGKILPVEAASVNAPSASHSDLKHPETWSGSWEATLESLQDLFSERLVQVKKVDLTTMALQGAATGFAAMGLLFVLFRPR